MSNITRGFFAFLGIVVLLVLARFVAVPHWLRLTADFEYTANILSLDNFYDAEQMQFLGESRSVTTFAYRSVEERESDDVVIVENVFDVRTISGDPIIVIRREYGIDQKTWQHQPSFGDQDRIGYLFAPRHLASDQAFSYWHVNYNKKLDMVFDGAEYVAGILTHRYITSFGVDQTNDLTHLPGVPEERGVNLDVSLSLWVEPASGWLVKYEDSAIAYYYDQTTGERLHPWNKFRNIYSQESIVEQAGQARSLKTRLVFGEVIVPIFLGFFVAVLLWWRSEAKLALLALLGVAFLTAIIYGGIAMRPGSIRDPITIGISQWTPAGNDAYRDNIQGFKDALVRAGYREGREIQYIEAVADADPDKQRDIARRFSRENVDLVFSQTTPGTQIIKDIIPNRPIVFSIVTYPVESGLINSLHGSGNNLVGTRNWVSVDEQLAVFREIAPTVTTIGFVRRVDESNSEIQFREMSRAAALFNIRIRDIAVSDLAELIRELTAADDIDGIYSACDTFVQGRAEDAIIQFAHRNHLPSFSCNVTGPLKGDLVGVVADFYQIGALAGEKAALILSGASPESLETSTVIRPFIYVNKKTANLLNIQIPQSIISIAEVIIE